MTTNRPESAKVFHVEPADLLAGIRRLLNVGQIHDARRLAATAVDRYPGDSDLRKIHETLNVGRTQRKPASGRSTREELEWLREPPEEYRGKWVALIDRHIVGVADSLKELVAALPSDLEQEPLAVQITP
jgi:Family of unknown function (DUF5678)